MTSSEKSSKSKFLNNEFSHDMIYSNDIIIAQHNKGYRFNADSMILSWFICRFLNNRKSKTALEIGSGSGIIPIILKKRGVLAEIDCFEIQESLYNLAVYNIEKNNIQGLRPFLGDFRTICKNGSTLYDFIFTNPPYFSLSSGKMSPDSEKAIAKHEVSGELKEFFNLSVKILKERGDFFFVYPVSRIQYALTHAFNNKLFLKNIFLFREYPDTSPTLFAAHLSKGKINHNALSEIITIREKDDSYTSDGNNIFFGK